MLVVCSETNEQEILGSFFKDDKTQLDFALNDAEAQKLLSETDYDAVITDHLLPEIDGIGLYMSNSRIKHGNGEKFIFLTSKLTGIQEKFINLTGRPHLMRPVSLPLLERAVSRILK